MLNTNEFFDCLVQQGYTHLCVVPCSFAKNLINVAVNNRPKASARGVDGFSLS